MSKHYRNFDVPVGQYSMNNMNKKNYYVNDIVFENDFEIVLFDIFYLI